MLSSSMMTLQQQLQILFTNAIAELHPEAKVIAEVTQATNPKFGHYQCNSAMRLGKNPRAIAEELTSHIKSDIIEKLEVAGPGFINIHLKPNFLAAQVDEQLRDERLGAPKPAKKQRIIIDFSSPNVAKELHVGHLRSTIIGESLARLFETLGHDVLRLNHVGDWGTQFGMLIAYLKHHEPLVFSGEVIAELPDLMSWYRAAKQIFDQDPAFKKQAQDEVVHLQGGDTDSLKAWNIICDISRRAFQEIYDLLDVSIEERGESFYNKMLPDVIEEFDKKGLITVDDGAKCVFMDQFKVPFIIQKSNGGYNYATTDLATIRHRIRDERGDRLIYVIDLGQKLHLQQLFAAAEKVGYLDPAKTTVEHVGFGVVLGPDGKKFKTRSGETERLIDLLERAVSKACEMLQERLPDTPQEEVKELGKVLGINAVKYSDLSCHRQKDYVFSYDRMLRFEGNTAAFLLYSYVRIQSIKRKVNIDLEQVLPTTKICLSHPSELALALHLRQFPEALHQMDLELLPNRLTDYLYKLAETFNAFFRDCRVADTPEQNSRLLLIELASRIMARGFHILSLKPMDRM
ncbi:MAG: arginine--tRNA ligase [Simkaniaceae bacterium]|nr:arginine--tRNA ligase [Simkaniaceae bacterium]